MLFGVWAWLFVCLGLGLSILGPSIPALRADYALSLGGAGVLFTIHSSGYLAGVLIAGPLSDRAGRRLVSAVGAAGLAVGMALAAFSPTWPLFLAAMVPCGIGFACIDVGLNAAIGDAVSDARKRAAAMNLLHGAFPLGTLIAPAALALAWRLGTDWRPTFVAIALVTALGLAPLLLRRPAWPDDALASPERERPPTATPLAIVRLLREPSLARLAAIQGLYVGVELGIAGWIATYLIDEFGSSGDAGALATSVYWGGFLVGRPITAWLTHRFDPLRLMRWTMAAGLVCGVVGIIAPSAAVAAAVYVGAALAICGVFPTVMSLALHGRQRDAGAVTALITAAAACGGLLLPWLVGAVADAAGLRAAMALTAAPLVPMLLLASGLHSVE
ncbi:MAG TPA: MFS transporter [Chloroflexota bacterium]|nr:MFS transporter [Chloroflexota bacterium]